jgi:putative methyltransferase (TIGR04325 family)
MKPAFKSLLTNVIPPILWSGLKTLGGGRSKWTGNYSNWGDAVAASSGYDAETIFDRARMAAHAVREGRALWERDSTCFYHEEYNWQLLACLMTVAARSSGKLHVLDFGGSLGSTYMQHQKLLAELPECSWSVVEQPHVVSCGEVEFTSGALDFFSNIEQCFLAHQVNVVLFSSVLQYLENPYELLEKVNKFSPRGIVIDRTPIAKHGERITIQNVPKSIYSASYPCRFLNKQRLEHILTKGRVLSPWFVSPVDPPNFVGVMSMITG